MTTPDIKSTVNDQFSKVAENYSTSTVHSAGIDLPVMLERAELKGDEVVLDAGTGAGHATFLFARNVQRITAIDLSQSMLDVCRKSADERELTNIDFQIADVESLPFPDAQFDLVISRYSAHHWPNPQTALAEIGRVLRPQGRFLLGDIVSLDHYAFDSFLQAIELIRYRSHVLDHSVSQWTAMFDQAGLQPELLYEWGCEIDFRSWVQRMQTPAGNVDVLSQLLGGASNEIRELLKIQDDASFTLPGALIRGTKN